MGLSALLFLSFLLRQAILLSCSYFVSLRATEYNSSSCEGEPCLSAPVQHLSLGLGQGQLQHCQMGLSHLLVWKAFLPTLHCDVCFKFHLYQTFKTINRVNTTSLLSLHLSLHRKRINQKNHPKCPSQHRFSSQQFLDLYPGLLCLSRMGTPSRQEPDQCSKFVGCLCLSLFVAPSATE